MAPVEGKRKWPSAHITGRSAQESAIALRSSQPLTLILGISKLQGSMHFTVLNRYVGWTWTKVAVSTQSLLQTVGLWLGYWSHLKAKEYSEERKGAKGRMSCSCVVFHLFPGGVTKNKVLRKLFPFSSFPNFFHSYIYYTRYTRLPSEEILERIHKNFFQGQYNFHVSIPRQLCDSQGDQMFKNLR